MHLRFSAPVLQVKRQILLKEYRTYQDSGYSAEETAVYGGFGSDDARLAWNSPSDAEDQQYHSKGNEVDADDEE